MTEEYELYVLDSENKLTLYGNFNIKNIKSKDVYCREINGNFITFYQTTDGTQIIFTNNGVTIVSPKGHKESFTQGYMRRNRR